MPSKRLSRHVLVAKRRTSSSVCPIGTARNQPMGIVRAPCMSRQRRECGEDPGYAPENGKSPATWSMIRKTPAPGLDPGAETGFFETIVLQESVRAGLFDILAPSPGKGLASTLNTTA